MATKLSWARKTSIENTIAGKHATINSRVRCTNRRGHEHAVPVGTLGKVVESGTHNESAKRALGTTSALRVEWDLDTSPERPCVHLSYTPGCAYCVAHPEHLESDASRAARRERLAT